MSAVIRQTGPINAPLPGLLDVFGLKTFGANPTDVAQVVNHVNDCLTFLVAGKRESFAATLTGTTVNGNAVLVGPVVPQNEGWLLDTLGLSMSMAGTVLPGEFTIGGSIVPGGPGITLFGPFAVGVGQAKNGGLVLPKPILLTSGFSFFVNQCSSTGAAFTAAPTGQFQASGARLRL